MRAGSQSNSVGNSSENDGLFLQIDQTVEFTDGSVAIIKPDYDRPDGSKGELGRGGQGVVYNVLYDGDFYALKWITNEKFFKTRTKPRFYDNIVALSSDKRSGMIFDNFTLPLKVTKVKKNGQFGYLMKKIPMNMIPMSKILSHDNDFALFDKQLDACINVAFAFAELHSYKMVFTDINEGSIFFDVNTAEVMICDCDNIVPTSEKPITIGKMGYMAPEVCTKKRCSIASDDFSLAIIIFWLLFRCDPYEGSKYDGMIIDKDLMQTMYIDNPQFILDPENTENVAEPELFDRWAVLAEDYKEAFYNTLVKGVNNPSLRSSTNLWSGTLMNWKKSIIKNPMRALPMTPVRRKTQIVMFIVDVSSSMQGKKIDSLNKAINRCMVKMKSLEEDPSNHNVHFAISILEFGSKCRWYNDNMLTDIQHFTYSDIYPDDSITRFDLVCSFLDDHFNEDHLFAQKVKYKRPFILLITDGQSDRDRYSKFLEELNTNRFYSKAQKYAIGVDDKEDQADHDMLFDFTQVENNILTVDADIDGKLENLIYNLTIAWSNTPDDPEAANLSDEDIEKMNPEDQ